jgi:nicotinamide mononucleotide transporter
MVARKVLENWLYWVVVDLAAAALYWSQGLYATAALFVVYAALAVRGYQQWSRDARSATAIPT